MDTLIRGATLVTMTGARDILREDLLIRDGAIVAIGKIPAAKGPRRVIDASGLVAIPGLIQAHIHLCQTLFRNHADGLELLEWLRERIWPFEAAHDPKSLKVSAELGIAELLLSGTTAILDMGTVRHHEVVFEAARETGLRYVGGKAMMDAGQGVPAALRETTQASIDDSLALLRTYHGQENGRLRYAFCPRFVLSSTPEQLREVAKLSKEHDCRVHTHASENQAECMAVRDRVGSDNVDYFHNLGLLGPRSSLAHGVWLTAHEQRLVADTGTCLVHCPSSNLKLASGIAKVPELAGVGVHWALGSDGAPCNNNLDAFFEMRLAALLPKPRLGPTSMPAQQVLEMATLGGARALGLEKEIGSLEVGKRADLVLLDLHQAHSTPAGPDLYGQIVYSATSRNVHTVIVDGQVRVQHGELLDVDLRGLLARAETEAKRITSRAL
ncbi:MAG: 5'-deoxyadenosine deaminase [Deltaproteobacteria bacterium]|nr:5'-deoxyadenosine deaminase [Deltaproteobacteria bacterium]